MRFAIHGREVRVPRLRGLTPTEAERLANSEGLVLSLESRFYSPDIPEGYIVSQSPAPDAKVRRGWKVRVAASLWAQRASVPNVVGESQRVAELNISRRGLAIGTVATIHYAGAQPSTVIAQDPPAGAKDAASPQVGLLVASADNSRTYIMPRLVGRKLDDAGAALLQSGFTLGKVTFIEEPSSLPGTILRQSPPAGQKIVTGATITFEVSK